MLDIQSRVFSRIKNKYPQSLKTKYPDTTFTTSDRVPESPTFPNVYVHELSSVERGRDLDGTSLNAVLSTIQVEVTDNESMSNAKEVMNNVVMTMKSMRYEVVVMPEFRNPQNLFKVVARFRRVIGAYDVL